MEANALIESMKFMFLGMSVVYLFLTIMIYAIKIQAKLIEKYFPIIEKQQFEKQQINVSKSNTAQKVAAITATIHHNQQAKGDTNE